MKCVWLLGNHGLLLTDATWCCVVSTGCTQERKCHSHTILLWSGNEARKLQECKMSACREELYNIMISTLLHVYQPSSSYDIHLNCLFLWRFCILSRSDGKALKLILQIAIKSSCMVNLIN